MCPKAAYDKEWCELESSSSALEKQEGGQKGGQGEIMQSLILRAKGTLLTPELQGVPWVRESGLRRLAYTPASRQSVST